MERSWSWRVALVVIVAVLSVWQLVPSYYYFKLPPEQRLGEEFEKTVPGWAPAARKHLNLGLDLQGGIHLAMGVDVDRAVKAARAAQERADGQDEGRAGRVEQGGVGGGGLAQPHVDHGVEVADAQDAEGALRAPVPGPVVGAGRIVEITEVDIADYLDLLPHVVEDQQGLGDQEAAVPGADRRGLERRQLLDEADHVVAEIADGAAEKPGHPLDLDRGEPCEPIADETERFDVVMHCGGAAVFYHLDAGTARPQDD